jgi:large subunit ribosomal protein MRP49
MPRLKYWNPAVPMTVNRGEDQAGPATMTVYIRDSSSTASSKDPGQQAGTESADTKPNVSSDSSVRHTSAAPPAAPQERTVLIEMKHQKSNDILKQLLHITRAQPVSPTADERQKMAEIRLRAIQSDNMRKRVAEVVEAAQKEKRIMANSLAQAAEIRAEN